MKPFGKLLRAVLVAGAVLLATTVAGSASDAARLRSASYFIGYGFDTCGAPSLEAMEAWLDSPYRAIGIYLGGSNRACPDGNLKPNWVNSVRAQGWNLLPLWVGLQAPCVSQSGLKLISPGSAGTQGKAAAANAAQRAAYFGIGTGYPIYFDMEHYNRTPSCTLAVQRFVSAWVNELHARGYLAGVYGSASSTIRDLVNLFESGSGSVPDDIWIARWNGVEAVFGEPEVPDEYWSDHQRVHQYRGGHKETYGGVTINIDSNYVDGAVVDAAATLPAGPPIGTVGSSDARATVSWWENSFEAETTVTLTPSTLATQVQGLAAGSYLLQLTAADVLTGVPLTRFGTLLAIHVNAPPPPKLAVAYSADGVTWKPVKRLSSAAVPVGQTSGYQLQPDGSIDIYTLVPGYFGLMTDIESPTAPATLKGRLSKRKLLLTWPASTDNAGAVGRYQVTLGGKPIQTVAGSVRKTSLTKFRKRGLSVYRVRAIDLAGNPSSLSRYVKIRTRLRPHSAPRAIPRWAWRVYKWQQKGKKGKRPRTPLPLPGWYWRWAGWQVSPYRLVH